MIVCTFFLFRYETSASRVEKMSERASAPAWKMMIREAGWWRDRVLSAITSIKGLKTAVYVITDKTTERETNVCKSLTELRLEICDFKRFLHRLCCRVLITFHSRLMKGSDIDSGVRSSSEGGFASGKKEIFSSQKKGEKKRTTPILLPTIIGCNGGLGSRAPVARQPSLKLSIYKPSSK